MPADVAGAFVNLEPLVGALAAAVAFHEPFGGVQLAGAAAILAGLALGSLRLPRKRPPAKNESGDPHEAISHRAAHVRRHAMRARARSTTRS